MRKFSQAYVDVPFTKYEVKLAKRHFQREYNVLTEDIYEMFDTDFAETTRRQKEFIKRLETDKRKLLCIHVYAGHSVQLDDKQALLLNEYDSTNKFYKCFPFERWIRLFGEHFPHTYHFAMFSSCREGQKSYAYDYMSAKMAKKKFESPTQNQAEVI